MNKKIITLVSVAVIAAILVLWWVLRHSPFGPSHNFPNDTIGLALSLLGLPMRLHAIYVGENSSWSPPVLVLFLILSGLMWGIIAERIAWVISRWKRAK
ncbi:MAG TPA: hypothetical protein VMF08_16055 [Candidatus Sulfotelmatobacter sp.]|nr:hypothetical protein [Candidatus Sulfotelmatobacter sp.]